MRTMLLALTTSMAVGSVAHAEPVRVIDLSSDGPIAHAERLRDEARRAVIVRNVGIALTLVGVAGTIAGSIVAVQNADIGDPFSGHNDTDGNSTLFRAGIGVFAAGQVAATAGIAMWATGGAIASNKKRSLVSIGPTGATFRF